MTDTPTERKARAPGPSCAAARWCSGALPTPRAPGDCCRASRTSATPSTGPSSSSKLATLALLIGLPIVLVLAWYHGDRGEQRVGRTELAILTLLFLLGGGLFWRYQHASRATPTAASAATAAPRPRSRRPTPAPRSPSCRSRIAATSTRTTLLRRRHPRRHPDAALQGQRAEGDLAHLGRAVPRHEAADPRASREQLGVKSILEGGVQRAGDRVRINVQLIDAGTDAHLWAETYDRELTAENIFAIQSEVGRGHRRRAQGDPDAGGEGASQGGADAEPGGLGGLPARQAAHGQAHQRRHSPKPRSSSARRSNSIRSSRWRMSGWRTRWSCRSTTVARPRDRRSRKADRRSRRRWSSTRTWPRLGLVWTDRRSSRSNTIAPKRCPPRDRTQSQLCDRAPLVQQHAERPRSQSTKRLRRCRASRRARSSVGDRQCQLGWRAGVAGSLHGGGSSHTAERSRLIHRWPATYANLAILMAYALNRFADAVPLVQKAVELDPGNPSWSLALAILYLDLGDESESFATIEQAAKRWPDDPAMLSSGWLSLTLIRRDNAGTVRHARASRSPCTRVTHRHWSCFATQTCRVVDSKTRSRATRRRTRNSSCRARHVSMDRTTVSPSISRWFCRSAARRREPTSCSIAPSRSFGKLPRLGVDRLRDHGRPDPRPARRQGQGTRGAARSRAGRLARPVLALLPRLRPQPRLDPQRTRIQGRLRRHRARHGAPARRARRAPEGRTARPRGTVHLSARSETAVRDRLQWA